MHNLKQRNSYPCPLIASTYSPQCQLLFVFNWNIPIMFQALLNENKILTNPCLHRAYILLIETHAYSSHNICILLELTPSSTLLEIMAICEDLKTIIFQLTQPLSSQRQLLRGQFCLDFGTAPELSSYSWLLPH